MRSSPLCPAAAPLLPGTHRMQEVVFIGTHMDHAAVAKIVDTCLVTERELEEAKQSGGSASEMKDFEDPFLPWAQAK